MLPYTLILAKKQASKKTQEFKTEQKRKLMKYDRQRLLDQIKTDGYEEIINTLYNAYCTQLRINPHHERDISNEAITLLVSGQSSKLARITMDILCLWNDLVDQSELGFSYNKTSIISLNPKFINTVHTNIFEFDFNAFFSNCLLQLANSRHMTPGILNLVQSLITLRLITKQIPTIMNDDETDTLWFGALMKKIVNQIVGLIGSDKCQFSNPRLHNEILQLARNMITIMQDTIINAGYEIVCIYTDAVFFKADNASQQAIDDLMQSIIEKTNIQITQTRFQRFMHSSNLNNYIGLEDDTLIQKGIPNGLRLLFNECHMQLLISNGIVNSGTDVYQQAFDIIQNDDFEQASHYLAIAGKLDVASSFDEQDNSTNTISKVSVNSENNEMLSMKNLAEVIRVVQLYGGILDANQTRNPIIKCRVETVSQGKTTYTQHAFDEAFYLINYIDAQIDKSVDFAIHEVFINQDNCFVVDIDMEHESPQFHLTTEELVTDVANAIHSHRLFAKHNIKVNYSYSSYRNDHKHSIHLVFEIVLPLFVQKAIIKQTKNDYDMQYLDIAIYSVGKSLRLFNCAKVVNNTIDNDKILRFDVLTNPMRLIASNIVGVKHIRDYRIDDYQMSLCFERKPTIPFDNANNSNLLKSNDLPATLHALRLQIEQMTNLTITKFNLQQTTGNIQFKHNNVQCFICKRTHAQNSNQTIKTYRISKHKEVVTISLDCRRNTDRNELMVFTIPDVTLIEDQQPNIKNIMKYDTDIQYLPLRTTLKSRTCLFIKSQMGTGKTSQVIQPLVHSSKSCILVTTRRIQSGIFAKKLNMKSYLDINGAITIDNAANSKVCVQLESLKRIVLKQGKFDLLVLDEIMSILQQANSSIQQGSFQLVSDLVFIVSRATRIVICDSQLEQSTIDLFKSLILANDQSFHFEVINNKYQPYTKRNIRYYTGLIKNKLAHKQIIEQTIIQEAKKHQGTWITCGSQRYANHLRQVLLANNYQESEIALFTGKNGDTVQDNEVMQAFKNRIFSDLTQLDQFKVVITTSCITSAIDVNSNHFTLCIGVLTSGTFTAQQAVQALHRCRQVTDMIIFTDRLNDYKSFGLCQAIDIMSEEFAKNSKGINDTLEPMKVFAYISQYLRDLNYLGSAYLKHQLITAGYPLIEESIDSIEIIQQQEQPLMQIVALKQDTADIMNYFPIITQNQQGDLIINTSKWQSDPINNQHLLQNVYQVDIFIEHVHLSINTGVVSIDQILVLTIESFSGRDTQKIKKAQHGFQLLQDATTLFVYEHQLFTHFALIADFRHQTLALPYQELSNRSEQQIEFNTLFDDQNSSNIHNYTYLLQYMQSWIHRLLKTKKTLLKDLAQDRQTGRMHQTICKAGDSVDQTIKQIKIHDCVRQLTAREIKSLATLIFEHQTVPGMTPVQLSAYFEEKKPHSLHYAKIASFAGYQFESKDKKVKGERLLHQTFTSLSNIFDVTSVIVKK